MEENKKVIFSKTIEIDPEGAEVFLDGNDGKSIRLRVKVIPRESTQEMGLKARIGVIMAGIASLAIVLTYRKSERVVETCLIISWLPALWWSLRWGWMKWRSKKHG